MDRQDMQDLKFAVSVPKFIFSNNSMIRVEWCEEHVGEIYKSWTIKLPLGEGNDRKTLFMFLNEQDAMLFALRWANVTV